MTNLKKTSDRPSINAVITTNIRCWFRSRKKDKTDRNYTKERRQKKERMETKNRKKEREKKEIKI